MNLLQTINWDLIALTAFCLINFILVVRCNSKLRHQKASVFSQKHRIHELEEDVRALYESASTLGNKLHSLEKSSKMLKEQQEQLTLKEPNQQTYRNAIKAIHNGDTINQVADSSGLSRGEVELLTLLQKIHNNAKPKESAAVKS